MDAGNGPHWYEGPHHLTQDLKYICQNRDNDLISRVPQKWGTFMIVPQVPQTGDKWGTKKRAHMFFEYILYYSTDELQNDFEQSKNFHGLRNGLKMTLKPKNNDIFLKQKL